jgi:hypothetical protein
VGEGRDEAAGEGDDQALGDHATLARVVGDAAQKKTPQSFSYEP